ncbi:hypothetical protein BRX37_19965 [Sphingomonas sp. S-NIH.Pt3_0716]|nr:hypothetical protein BRX37_19965 [Sphingomonas sp. S-NIH.Pt3_0716]
MMGPFRKGRRDADTGSGVRIASAQVVQGEEQATTTHARALHDKGGDRSDRDTSTAVMAAERHNRLLIV